VLRAVQLSPIAAIEHAAFKVPRIQRRQPCGSIGMALISPLVGHGRHLWERKPHGPQRRVRRRAQNVRFANSKDR
jgi:hypothetical protein